MFEQMLAVGLRALARFRPPDERADTEALAAELDRVGRKPRSPPARPGPHPSSVR